MSDMYLEEMEQLRAEVARLHEETAFYKGEYARANDEHLWLKDRDEAVADMQTANSERDTARAQFTAMTADRDAERQNSSNMLVRLREETSDLDKTIKQLTAARAERDASNLEREEQWKELQAARADAAVMREALQRILWSSWVDCNAGRDKKMLNPVDALVFKKWNGALAGDAGRALLAEVARLREEDAALRANIVGRCERVFNGFGAAGMAAELAQASAEIVEQHHAHAATKAALGRVHAAAETYHGKARETCGCSLCDVLADPEGHAAAEYVKTLEAIKDAALALKVDNDTPEIQDLNDALAAHAVVEALRTVKL